MEQPQERPAGTWPGRLSWHASDPRHTVVLLAHEAQRDRCWADCHVDGRCRGRLEFPWWTFPDIALGAEAALVWGDRALYLLPYATDEVLESIQDEPVWEAYQRGPRRILVREISVVVYDLALSSEIAIFRLPDIPSRIWWEGDTLLVRDFNGLLLRFAWDDVTGLLSPIADDPADSPPQA